MRRLQLSLLFSLQQPLKPLSLYTFSLTVANIFRGATQNTVYRKYFPVLLTKGIESNIW